ncbi:SHOCT domain-containing protein [Desulfitobacterium sp. PCE1]|uniref:SHOCT domain-containing protein n=1 Tax=Desulfitobacterium sp. PCE1 TaxID=146907 RepID=UPI001FA7BBC7|nr:SHOCT domain-containing protein [Desulfitobacterium sp. PCE1]
MKRLHKSLCRHFSEKIQSYLTNEQDEKNTSLSAADEIKKYKELLDIGAISQDEYEAKKKQLLGL